MDHPPPFDFKPQDDDDTAAAAILTRIEDVTNDLWRLRCLPRRDLRRVAHVLYARSVYATHVRPHLEAWTLAEIANRLDRLKVPRFRGANAWTAAAVSTLCAFVEGPEAQIWLSDG